MGGDSNTAAIGDPGLAPELLVVIPASPRHAESGPGVRRRRNPRREASTLGTLEEIVLRVRYLSRQEPDPACCQTTGFVRPASALEGRLVYHGSRRPLVIIVG
jgi:hypothetical protein